jgi:hypothetical protein
LYGTVPPGQKFKKIGKLPKKFGKFGEIPQGKKYKYGLIWGPRAYCQIFILCFLGFCKKLGILGFVSIMFACFGHNSDSDASSSNISLPPTDPSRTLEALVQKNMFSRPEFLSTPHSK